MSKFEMIFYVAIAIVLIFMFGGTTGVLYEVALAVAGALIGIVVWELLNEAWGLE